MFDFLSDVSIKAIVEGFLGNLLWVTFGGGLAIVIKAIYNKINRAIVEAKQSIAGEYISFYEDDDSEGKTKWKTAPITLIQNGYDVKGSTEFDRKKWDLKGEISEGKYLYGMYWSTNPHDPGTGNFFLQIEECENRKVESLRGIWSGYDSDNHKITSGQYKLRRKCTPVISRHKSSNIPRMIEIAENQLGKSYISDKDFTDDKNIVLRAGVGKETAGFSIVSVLTNEEFSKAFHKIYNSGQRFIGHAATIGVVKSVAVAENYKRRGIGDSLVRFSINELKLSNANVVVMVGWKSKFGTNIESLALRNGFRKVCEIKNYWSDDSLVNNYNCPVCGKPPCACSAAIYTLHIEP